MRRMVAIVIPVFLTSLLFLVGCSGKEEDFGKRKYAKRDDQGKPDDSTKTVDPSKDGLKPIKGTGLATLKGTIKLVGDFPDFMAMTEKLQASMIQDRSVCLMGSEREKSQYTWVVDKDSRGVNNVFVWMRPVDEKKEFFDVADMVKEGKGFDKFKAIDQPFCAFEPHALVLFPRYIDPAKPVATFRLPASAGGPPATGQEFVVKNTGTLNHNTSTDGDPSRMKPIGLTVPSKSQISIGDIQPSYKSPVQVKCSIHPWMQSWVWAFDHPFSGISGGKFGDKELPFGEYRIENIPAGVKLRVVAWHEDAQFLNGGEKGEEITLKEGDNTKDFTVSYKK